MGSEYITFAIVEAPFRNLTTGALSSYGLAVDVRSNYVFNPIVYDAFSHSLEVPNTLTLYPSDGNPGPKHLIEGL